MTYSMGQVLREAAALSGMARELAKSLTGRVDIKEIAVTSAGTVELYKGVADLALAADKPVEIKRIAGRWVICFGYAGITFFQEI